jgi:hypothetical protein
MNQREILAWHQPGDYSEWNIKGMGHDPNFWINVIHNLCIDNKFAIKKNKIIRVPNEYNRESILNKLKSFIS